MKFLVHILICSFVLGSCAKQDLPEDSINDEVLFYAEGTAGNQVFFLQAGPDNVVVESEADLVEGELPLFDIRFFNSACEPCDEEVFIQISGSEMFNDNLSAQEILPLGSYALEMAGSDMIIENNYELNFSSNDFQVFDAQTSEVYTENGVYELGSGFYQYTIELTEDECTGEVQGSFFISESGEICLNQISFIELDGDIYMDFTGFGSDLIFLNINGIDIAPMANSIISLQELLDMTGSDELEILSVISLGIESCNASPLVYTFDSNFSFCNYDLEIEQAIQSIERSPLTAAIRYSDGDGNEYQSTDSFSEDYFELIEMEVYDIDPFGRESYRCQAAFRANLVNVNNESDILLFDISEAYIPIALE